MSNLICSKLDFIDTININHQRLIGKIYNFYSIWINNYINLSSLCNVMNLKRDGFTILQTNFIFTYEILFQNGNIERLKDIYFDKGTMNEIICYAYLLGKIDISLLDKYTITQNEKENIIQDRYLFCNIQFMDLVNIYSDKKQKNALICFYYYLFCNKNNSIILNATTFTKSDKMCIIRNHDLFRR